MADSITDHNALQVASMFQKEGLSVNWQLNQNSSIVEHQARDLEVRGSSPGSGSNFLLKSDKEIKYGYKCLR